MSNPSIPLLLSSPRTHVVLLLLFCSTVLFTQLGGNGLAAFDDAYYAQKAKEILALGSWMTIHYNGTPEFSNPPFFLWLIAISYSLFGVSEFAAKLPSAVMGLCTVVLVYFLARYLFGARPGPRGEAPASEAEAGASPEQSTAVEADWIAFFSAVVLVTTNPFTRYARHAMMDVTLTFFYCLAILALLVAVRRDRRFYLLWGSAISVCVLIKSVLGLLPLAVSVAWLIATGRKRQLLDPFFLSGCVILGTLGFSWYYHQLAHFGLRFFDFHFGWVIFERGLDWDLQTRAGFGSYMKWIAWYYWPWIPLAAWGLRTFARRWRRDETAKLLLLWVLIGYVPLEIAHSRVIWYIMPVFAALAMIVGATLNDLLKVSWKPAVVGVVAASTAVLFPLFAFAVIELEMDRERDIREFAPIAREFAARGGELIAFRLDYHRVNNPLLFYTDQAVLRFFNDPAAVRRALRRDPMTLCVVKTADLGALGSMRRIGVLHEGEELSLVMRVPR